MILDKGKLMKKLLSSGVCAALLLAFPTTSFSHSGGLNSEGCHNDRKRGGYHCHRSADPSPAPTYKRAPLAGSSGGSYRNCSAARAAGAAPVYRGDPGYGAHLDRDNDGVGCE